MTSSINYQKLFVFVFLYLSFGAFLYPYVVELSPIQQTCLFSSITGHPSPSCGVTRALVSLLHLNPLLAFQFNPLATLLWLSGIVATLSILTTGKPNVAFILSGIRERKALLWFAGCSVALNWLYLLQNERFLQENHLSQIPLLF